MMQYSFQIWRLFLTLPLAWMGLCSLEAAVVMVDLTAENGGSDGEGVALEQHVTASSPLEVVTMRLTGTISGQLDVANTDPKYDIIYGTLAGRMIVLDAENNTVLSLDLSQTGYFEMDPDSTYSFNGLGDSGSVYRQYILGVDDLTPFIGSGTIPYTITMSDLSFAVTGSGGPATTYFTQLNGHAEFEISYQTAYIPEPGNLTTMGIVFALCFGLRRWQREQRRQGMPSLIPMMPRTPAITLVGLSTLEPDPEPEPESRAIHHRRRKRRSHRPGMIFYGLAVLAQAGLALPETRAEEVEITGLSAQQGSVHLLWDRDLDRYIVEQFSLQGDAPLAVGSSTGSFDRSILVPPGASREAFYRLHPGLAAIFFRDPVLDAVIRSHLTANRAGPTNWIYDSEVAGISALRLNYLNVSGLNGLGGLAALSSLDVGGNAIQSLGDLGACSGLQTLRLDGNGLNNLSGLERLVQLRSLDISLNDLSTLQPLAPLAQLQFLYADGNQIVDISSLAGLVQLQTVDLSGNLVRDISPLLDNASRGGLGDGDSVYLAGNPLDDPGQVVALRGYGVKVNYP